MTSAFGFQNLFKMSTKSNNLGLDDQDSSVFEDALDSFQDEPSNSILDPETGMIRIKESGSAVGSVVSGSSAVNAESESDGALNSFMMGEESNDVPWAHGVEYTSVLDRDRSKRFEFLLKQTEIFTHFMRPAYADALSTTSLNNTSTGKTSTSVIKDSGIKTGSQSEGPGTLRRSTRAKSNNGKEKAASSNSTAPEDQEGSESQEDDPRKPRRHGRPRKAKSQLLKFFNPSSPRANDADSAGGSVANQVHSFASSPSYIMNGQMRDYQVRGLNWLISLYQNGISGILADEMGLGKTIQTISLLGYLKHYRNIPGPHLVIVPKSTIRNWMIEIEKWCPSLKAVSLIGDKDFRKEHIRRVILPGKWNICVTSYDMVLRESLVFRKFNWLYLIVDEAHRIKNENSLLSLQVRELRSQSRLLLTGTPLQNNLHELWSLLNFLLPDVFNSSEDFDSWFNTNNFLGDQTVVTRLHNILRPFFLRRIKADVEKGIPPKKELKVYVGLSTMQREWYRKVLLQNIEVLRWGFMAKSHLHNTLMHLRKVCNHPYLFSGAEPEPFTTDTHLINNCGKMIVLDKLLPRFKAEGSKVLIFSQMTRMMDILEDYCFMKKYNYCRLDGQTSLDDRNDQMVDFNSADSSKFLFLLSTRAGGLGINLTAADVVVLYDSDWNPQVDLQAMDRCHRIGQTKEVRIFRLITENTIEEKIVERAEFKLHLDRIAIQHGRLVDSNVAVNHREMKRMIQFGAEKIFADTKSGLTDEDITSILKKSKIRTEEIAERFASMDEKTLRHFTIDAQDPIPTSANPVKVHHFEGVDYRVLRDQKEKIAQIETDNLLSDRQRRHQSMGNSGDMSGESFMFPNITLTSVGGRDQPRKTKRMSYVSKDTLRKPEAVPGYHFCSPMIYELCMQELDDYYHASNYRVPLNENLPISEALELQKFEQSRLGKCFPLTFVENTQKNKLLSEGFRTWGLRDLKNYIAALTTFGIDDLKMVSGSVRGKKSFEVVAYHQVFWKRCVELLGIETMFQDETLNSKVTELIMKRKHILDSKIAQYSNPSWQLKIQYDSYKGKRFTRGDDRALLMELHKIGLENINCFQQLHTNLRNSSESSWFLRSRTLEELHARCNILLNLLEMENGSVSSTSFQQSVSTESMSSSPDENMEIDAVRRASETMDIPCSSNGLFLEEVTESKERQILSPVKKNRAQTITTEEPIAFTFPENPVPEKEVIAKVRSMSPEPFINDVDHISVGNKVLVVPMERCDETNARSLIVRKSPRSVLIAKRKILDSSDSESAKVPFKRTR